MAYIWEQTDWTRFRWDRDAIEPLLRDVRFEQGKLLGNMEALGFPGQQDALLRSLTEEIQKSSEIEDEILATESVRSSVARRLGMDIGGLLPEDRHVEGIVELVLDATRNCGEELSEQRLLGWHAALFPTGHSGILKISAGQWRTDSEGTMKVLSGPMGRETIHYVAPPAARLQSEMTLFLDWFNSKGPDKHPDPLLASALAHLWFVTVHPFDDGNGRIARAIADMALARADGTGDRYYSMSAQIRKERSTYYEILETTQKGDGNITGWLTWYLECLGRAIGCARDKLADTRRRVQFWENANRHDLNARQRLMITRLLEGFEGKLTSSKWAALAKCSQDTAGRDIEALIAAHILRKGDAGGRSTWYALAD